ncbi:hypothetical protein COX69_04010 [Candidatus Falkowbacteria bacterium CG_4_10_14_0_2_um_filter_48_10]|uniref:Uncharacterized protein n=1 Tax=Candidatus Falkowbacteria bacterium CG23_combo_of_CG06-09_8_20_14_all_49_15 TaxID=1974572 RepID=A0A2G9ZLJ3_9BACT|nr:MAG: hypothetical protein COX22_01085 [Candidatus Falkowbacteria bacterium CG23_combo_of_CG06-09_8_20_14_all_49_15]PJA07692.1 MAG: hypothetical protein COX69_04010 [Candidatus Falkowbacteria bacterium CG_4_10_14_0_2_um_filter_48_10]
MSMNKVEQLPVGQDQKELFFSNDVKNQIVNKLWAAWRTARKVTEKSQEGYGEVVNQHMTGEIFYDALFQPNKALGSINERMKKTIGGRAEDLKINADDVGILKEPVKDPVFLASLPDREDFIQRYCHAMTNEVRFQDAYFDGAEEEIDKMLAHGPVRIWTTGDVYGVPSLGLPGHMEQIKRVARGFHDFRQEKIHKEIDNARTRGLSEVEVKDLRKRLKNSGEFGYVAHEDKVEALKKVAADFLEKQVDWISVIDDKVQNLLNAKQRLEKIKPGLGDKAIMVWDRQSELSGVIADHHSKLPKGFQGTEEDAIREYGLVEIKDVKDAVAAVMEKIGSNEGAKIGWIVDHDDVISEDNKRDALQGKSVIQLLESMLSKRTEVKEAA